MIVITHKCASLTHGILIWRTRIQYSVSLKRTRFYSDALQLRVEHPAKAVCVVSRKPNFRNRFAFARRVACDITNRYRPWEHNRYQNNSPPAINKTIEQRFSDRFKLDLLQQFKWLRFTDERMFRAQCKTGWSTKNAFVSSRAQQIFNVWLLFVTKNKYCQMHDFVFNLECLTKFDCHLQAQGLFHSVCISVN